MAGEELISAIRDASTCWVPRNSDCSKICEYSSSKSFKAESDASERADVQTVSTVLRKLSMERADGGGVIVMR